MRLILGEDDSVLVEGDVVGFDIRTPHRFGSTGVEPAEVLSLFSRPVERRPVGAPAQAGEPTKPRSTSS